MEGGKLTHSHSQPGGMDRTPPGTPKKGGKMLAVRVQMLDDSITMFQVQAKALGRVLFEQVCKQLHLLESDYFGLEYQEVGGTKYWLDLEKPLSRQIGLSLIDTLVRFCVKFYTPDPSQLEEEFTRYLFCLQIKRDLSQGLLQCNDNTAALMASYIVQAECGDYVVEDYPDHRYLSSYKFVPNQDHELERRIMENHKKHAGQSPAEADLNLLETARRCELYGIKMHPAKDHEGVPLNLAVAHMGIVVFQNYTKINTFSWAKIRKISFKRKRFLVKLHPEGYGYYKDTVEFFFEGRNECKNFWKKCVENHGFFRCSMVKRVPRQKTRVLSRGSSFRYSGRTQKQIVEFVRENYVKRQTFQRSQSFRHSSSAHSSVANVGTSISAHPLLPLGDNAVAGTPASLSCGSMTLTSSPLHTADIHAGGSPSPPLTTSVSPGTSVTSSPQHFYPQETPYRRPGHQPTRLKHPHVQSLHTTSPLQSPTSAATAANNRSANHTNNNVIVDDNEIANSRISLKSPEFNNFNDVYSNCYDSLRNLRNVTDNNIDTDDNKNKTKSDLSIVSRPLVSANSKSSESIKSSSKKIKSTSNKKQAPVERYTWYRSASCKDLYHEENNVEVTETKNEKNLREKETTYEKDGNFQIGFDSPITRYDDTRRTCYSAVVSKTPSIDRTGDVITDTKIYSSSYPGTTSSLSTESAEGEPSERVIDMIDINGSQEEIVLSHDDLSHDSYELLEREFDDFDNSVDESSKSKSRRVISESDRTRSCSWGSDRGTSPLDSRLSEKGVSPVDSKRENGFRSLERSKTPKHKSEADFRSLDRKSPKHRDDDRKSPKGSKTSMNKINEDYRKYGTTGRRRSREYEYDNRSCVSDTRRRSKEIDDDVFRTPERISPLDSRVFSPKDFEDRDIHRSLEREARQRKRSKEYDQDNFNSLERRKYQDRRRSREELEIFPMDSEEEFIREEQRRAEERRRMERKREKDRRDREERFHEGIKEKEVRQLERRKSIEEDKQKRLREEELARKAVPKHFEEPNAKKYERVVSNQFGGYSEFLTRDSDYELMLQERKVLENYEKVCQVGRMAKEMERNERASKYGLSSPSDPNKFVNAQIETPQTVPIAQDFKPDKLTDIAKTTKDSSSKISQSETGKPQVGQFKEFNAKTKGGVVLGFTASPKGSPKLGKAPVERTKSDPYDSSKNLRRNVLMHQKSIDLTPQDSGEVTSDYDNDDMIKKTSRSEHDIPYILHKRHCMNGTAKDLSSVSAKSGISVTYERKAKDIKPKPMEKKPEVKKATLEEPKLPKPRPSSPQIIESKKAAGVEIINLDEPDDEDLSDDIYATIEPKKPPTPPLITKPVKPIVAKKPILTSEGKVAPKSPVRREITPKKEEPPRAISPVKKPEEPIYAQVIKGKVILDKKDTPKKVPPEPPKRTTPIAKPEEKKIEPKPPERTTSLLKSPGATAKKIPPEPPKRTTSAQKLNIDKSPEPRDKTPSPTKPAAEVKEDIKKPSPKVEPKEEPKRPQPGPVKGKADLTMSIAPHKREESLILFARTRLGLSEGSAFTPVTRQGHVGSPTSARRTKSLDAPVVSVHRLPAADAFSSKDDTVDAPEEDVVKSAAAKAAEFFKVDLKKVTDDKTMKAAKAQAMFDTTISTESEMDAFLPEDMEIDKNFKEVISQSKVDIPFPEEKVLDAVRSKRLLSKIDSVDGIDSEGDLDSSKLHEPPPIPPDRLVNLPESVRFPSVRQISGQTSEESADGWDPKEVKVKRRTPRRSTGREDPDTGIKESVVWDSKDDELPDDDVWDENIIYTAKHEGPIVTDAVVASEYLKRGSCGQSIDDDNLSTPMKESSPEHWVSVDDLPEAIEREERLLREQEKILREKILNEKLKRELNLDTIDIEERYYEYKSDSFRSSFEDVPLPVLPGKDKFKGHSLDTYELTEKKLRERCTNKNPSLDEHILRDDPIKSYLAMTSTLDVSDKSSSYENVPKIPKYERGLDYIKCKVVNDVDEIDQFGDNDDDLEEFVVVLDENLGDGKEGREVVWDDDNFSRRTVSKEESLISVPEEFKDVEEEIEEIAKDVEDKQEAYPEIRLDNENQPSERRKTGEEHILESQLLEEKLRLMADEKVKLSEDKIHDDGRLSPYDTSSRRSSEDPRRSSMSEDPGRLSPFDGSRRGSEERRRLSASEDTGRLSPYDNSSRRSSDDPRRLSASDDAGRLSPFDDSRRGSEDPRRLSTSEDSRKYSISEDSVRVSTSVSEETRRRLSSTEETRRKRASLTKQCSVGVDSLSDDLIPGIQECSSSFEQDEKDVFESVPPVDAEPVKADAEKTESDTEKKDMSDAREVRKLAIEVSEDTSDTKEPEDAVVEEQVETDVLNHLAPPKGERELSRETEDSMDYGEGDFKEIRDVVKEKDISDGLTCDSDSLKSGRQSSKLPSSFEKSESSDKDELRFIDDKRGSTPEIIVGSSKETAAMSVVVVNEGIAVLNKIVERDRLLSENTKTQSLPRGIIVTDTDKEAAAQEQRHTLPKRVSKQKPALAPKPDYVHRKLAKAVPNIKTIPSPIAEITYLNQANIFESQDSSQDSDVDRLCEVSLLAQIQSQIARRNLSDAGRRLRRDVIGLDSESKSDVPLVKVFEEVEGSPSAKEDKMVWRQRTSLEEDDKPDEEQNSKEKKSPTGKPPEMENEKIKKEQKNEVEKPKEEKRTPDQEKRDSGEDVSSSSSAPPHPKRELSSTWRPFLLESSGSSSLEEGWLPPDDAAHLADEEETSSTSNNQQDDSLHDDVIDYPTQIGYPVLNMSSAEMMVGGYGSVFALSRTLSRISERSTTSEQERSDIEDDITKPSSHSVSIEEESIMSSDHQPSLSSDPPSPKASTSKIPDLPDDRSPIPENFIIPEDKTPVSEPFGDVIPPPLPDDDWPSPPDSSGVFDTPVVSHIETFYMEIHPEEAYKVVVAELQNEENSSSDENHTLQEEGEFLHLSSDNLSISTTTTTQDGTVIVPVRPKNMRTNSVSEDTSVMSTSDWSSSTTIRPRTNSNFGTTEDLSDWTRSTTLQDGSSSVKAHSKQGTSDEVSEWSSSTHRKQNQSAYSKSDEINSDNLGSRSEWQPSTKSGDTSQGATVSDWSSSASKFYSESYSSTLEYESSKPKTPSKSKPPKLKSPTSKNMGFFETPISKVRSPTSQAKFFERTEKGSSTRSPTSHSESTSPKNHGRFFESPSHYPRATEYYEVHKTKSPTKSGKFFESPKSSEHRKNVCTPYYSNVADVAEKSYFGRYDTGSLERGKIHSSRKCFSYYSVARSPPSEDDSSSNDAAPAPSSNTIPRASKRTKKRHRVAMDLQIRDGKIVAPPKTRTTVVENSDSDRSSPREYRSSSKETRRKQSDV